VTRAGPSPPPTSRFFAGPPAVASNVPPPEYRAVPAKNRTHESYDEVFDAFAAMEAASDDDLDAQASRPRRPRTRRGGPRTPLPLLIRSPMAVSSAPATNALGSSHLPNRARKPASIHIGVPDNDAERPVLGPKS